MDKTDRSRYLFYGLAPLAVYMGINFLIIAIGSRLGWTTEFLNVVAQLANLSLLYLMFYRTYHKREAAKEAISAMPVLSGLLVILLGLCCSMAFNGWFSILRLTETITTYEEVAESIYSGSQIMIMFRTIFLASFVEELLMRGLCYHALSRVLGVAAGNVLSALIFGIIHGNLLQGLYAFILGVLFAFVYEVYGRKLFVPVLAHISANLVSVLGTTVPSVSLWMSDNFYTLTVLATILLLAAIVGIGIIYRRAVRMKEQQQSKDII